MDCKYRTEKKYQTRPSPPHSAQDCPGMIKYGNDGNLYISVANIKGVYTWKRHKGVDPHFGAIATTPKTKVSRKRKVSKKVSRKRKVSKKVSRKRKVSRNVSRRKKLQRRR